MRFNIGGIYKTVMGCRKKLSFKMTSCFIENQAFFLLLFVVDVSKGCLFLYFFEIH